MQLVSERVIEIQGIPHRERVYEGNTIYLEPLAEADPALYARLERRRTMMGNSKRKTGG